MRPHAALLGLLAGAALARAGAPADKVARLANSSLRVGCSSCYYECCDNSGCCPLGTSCGTGSDASKCFGTASCGAAQPSCSSGSGSPPLSAGEIVAIVIGVIILFFVIMCLQQFGLCKEGAAQSANAGRYEALSSTSGARVYAKQPNFG